MVQHKLAKLNGGSVPIDEIERRVALLKENYLTYAKNLEIARIDEELRHQRISNVNLIQGASFVLKPIGPRRLILVLLGVFLALTAALATALGSEVLDQSFKSAEEVEQQLEIPVLLSIPHLDKRRLMMN